MRKLILALIFLFALCSLAQAADWFVRPAGQIYGSGNGTSYENAWSGLNNVKWFAVDGTGIQAGDTLWIGGNFGAQGGPGEIIATTGLTVKANGTAQNPITIRGDVSTRNSNYEDAVIYRSNHRYPHGSAGWTGVWTSVGYGVYKHMHIGTACWVYAANPATPGDLKSFTNIRACAGLVPTDQELQSFQPGDFWQNPAGGDVYVKPLAEHNPDPNNDDYLTVTMGQVFSFYERQAQTGAAPVYAGRSYIILKNLTCYGGGVKFVNSTNITIDNVKFYNQFYAASLYYNSNDITFKNCTIDGAGNGIYNIYYFSSDGYPFAGHSNRLLVENCTIKNIIPEKMGRGAPDCHGVAVQGGNGHIIRHNYFENCSSAVTGYIDEAYTEPFDMEVYGNFARKMWRWHNGKDFWHGCAYDVHGGGGSCTVTYSIHNNIAIDVENAGIRAKSFVTNPPSVRPRIFNNIIDHANIGISVTSAVAIDVRNNIITNPYDYGRGVAPVFISAYSCILTVDQWQFTCDYNLYYPNADSENRFHFNDSAGNLGEMSLSSWKAKIGNQEVHAQTGNPLYLNSSGTFRTASDFKVSSYSPAILTGIDVGLTKDFEDAPIIPIDSRVDMGAFQQSVAPEPTPPPPPPCSYSLSPTGQTFPFTGGKGILKLTAGTNCRWTATKNVSWISITSGTSGIGSGQVNFRVALNLTRKARTEIITVAGKQFLVTQK